MSVLSAILITVITFIAMEAVAWMAHKYVIEIYIHNFVITEL